MRKALFATAVLMGVFTLAASNASAALSNGLVNLAMTPAHAMPTNVDYKWHHRHWHHRRWEHGHWRYWG